MSVETFTVQFPDEAAIVTACLIVASYVRADGSTGYAVISRGDSPMTTFLGLTVVAQDHIKEWGSA